MSPSSRSIPRESIATPEPHSLHSAVKGLKLNLPKPATRCSFLPAGNTKPFGSIIEVTTESVGNNQWQWVLRQIPEIKPEDQMHPWKGEAGIMFVSLIPPAAPLMVL